MASAHNRDQAINDLLSPLAARLSYFLKQDCWCAVRTAGVSPALKNREVGRVSREGAAGTAAVREFARPTPR
jgi:hypothetical protein